MDALYDQARRSNDTATLERLGELTKAVRAQIKTENLRASKAEAAAKISPIKAAPTDGEVFHKLHTKAQPWGNAIAQVACAWIIRDQYLFNDPAAVEGMTFLVYNSIQFVIPGALMLFMYPDRISGQVKASIAFVMLAVIGLLGLLSWFGIR